MRKAPGAKREEPAVAQLTKRRAVLRDSDPHAFDFIEGDFISAAVVELSAAGGTTHETLGPSVKRPSSFERLGEVCRIRCARPRVKFPPDV
jgi:hypothetical protein